MMAKSKKNSRNRSMRRRTWVSARVARALPAQVEQMPLVQRAVEILEDGERRAATLCEERLGDLDRARMELADSLERLEWRTGREVRRFVKRFRTSAFAKAVRAVPAQLSNGVDTVLDRIGLMRTARHEEILARAKRRLRKQGKPAPLTSTSG
jgi:hypothetical protein